MTSVELNIIICAILDVLFVLMYNNTVNNQIGDYQKNSINCVKLKFYAIERGESAYYDEY